MEDVEFIEIDKRRQRVKNRKWRNMKIAVYVFMLFFYIGVGYTVFSLVSFIINTYKEMTTEVVIDNRHSITLYVDDVAYYENCYADKINGATIRNIITNVDHKQLEPYTIVIKSDRYGLQLVCIESEKTLD